MKRQIIQTADGSATIYLPQWNEHYHSKHGAVQEARHVFIEMGFHYFLENHRPNEISVLEIGFGTGLNALITFFEANKSRVKVKYTGVEAYPVASEEVGQLNYGQAIQAEEASQVFLEMHGIPWEETKEISTLFSLQKQKKFFDDISSENEFDLIYFDAFGPRVQPDLWTEDIFNRMYNALRSAGVLVTYSAKGSVRRAMQAVGFAVERLPGPPGKREMLRASKT